LRARRERLRDRRTAEQRDELAPFHQQFLPCFEAEDSTTGDLLHCGISKEPCPLWVINVQCGPSPRPCMSASPQKQTFDSRRYMSSWCQKATSVLLLNDGISLLENGIGNG